MKDVLLKLGLGEKEVRFYLFLLAAGWLTAAEIAKQLHETRTNTYMVLERLGANNLVEVDETTAVRKYAAADPSMLKSRLTAQQLEFKQAHAALAAAMPELSSIFQLSHHRPGVMYWEGLEGFKILLEDNAKLTEGTIDLIASDLIIQNPAAWELLQKGIAKRKARGVATRGLFHAPADKWSEIKKLQTKGYEVRRWGQEELPGEIVIYGNKVAFTVYRPSLIVTIMTNEIMAKTFKIIFGQLWATAQS